MKKLIRKLAIYILKKDIQNLQKKYVDKIHKLQDAIVDDNKEELMLAMYSVGKRRGKELSFDFRGKMKRVKNMGEHKVWTQEIEVSLK